MKPWVYRQSQLPRGIMNWSTAELLWRKVTHATIVIDTSNTIHAIGRGYRTASHIGLYYIRKYFGRESFTDMGLLMSGNTEYESEHIDLNYFYRGRYIKLTIDRNDWLYFSYFYGGNVVYIVSKNSGNKMYQFSIKNLFGI